MQIITTFIWTTIDLVKGNRIFWSRNLWNYFTRRRYKRSWPSLSFKEPYSESGNCYFALLSDRRESEWGAGDEKRQPRLVTLGPTQLISNNLSYKRPLIEIEKGTTKPARQFLISGEEWEGGRNCEGGRRRDLERSFYLQLYFYPGYSLSRQPLYHSAGRLLFS